MKQPSDDLFRLIKTMTVAEKRYFKQNSEINQTSELFDIINSLEEYDEETVKKRIKDESFRKNLKVHKNRLQQILLHSMRNYASEQTFTIRIREHIDYIDILMKKQLYELANQYIQRTKKLCEQHEEYELLLVVLGIEARQASYFREFVPTENTPILEMQTCIKDIDNYTHYAVLSREVLNQIHSHHSNTAAPEVRDFLNAFVEKNMLQHPEMQPRTPIAKRMYNHIMALWRSSQKDSAGEYDYSLRTLQLFEQNPHLQQNKSTQFFNCIVNHLSPCRNTKRYSEIEERVLFLEKLTKQHLYLQPFMLYGYFYYETALHAQTRWDDMVDVFENKIEPLVAQYQLQQEYTAQISFLEILEAYLVLKKWQKMAKCLNYLLYQNTQLPLHLLYVAVIFELVYHIEQKDYALLENVSNSFQKRLRRTNEQHPIMTMIFNFAKKFNQLPAAEHRQHLSQHLAQIEKHKEDLSKLELNTSFHYLIWLKSKDSKEDFAEMLKK